MKALPVLSARLTASSGVSATAIRRMMGISESSTRLAVTTEVTPSAVTFPLQLAELALAEVGHLVGLDDVRVGVRVSDDGVQVRRRTRRGRCPRRPGPAVGRPPAVSSSVARAGRLRAGHLDGLLAPEVRVVGARDQEARFRRPADLLLLLEAGREDADREARGERREEREDDSDREHPPEAPERVRVARHVESTRRSRRTERGRGRRREPARWRRGSVGCPQLGQKRSSSRVAWPQLGQVFTCAEMGSLPRLLPAAFPQSMFE